MWTKVFEFLPHGHYLQLASVSTGWRALYASSMQQQGRAQSQKETSARAMVASVPLIQWAISYGSKESIFLLEHAAACGPLQVLQYLHLRANNGACRALLEGICAAAAERGHLQMLQWVHAQGYPWSRHASAAAAHAGRLEVLQWALATGCDINSSTCAAAALGGHLEVLKWARSAGCEWSEGTCNGAAEGGHLGILQYARSHGCPWDGRTWYDAALNGHLQLLQWAHANGCPLHPNAYPAAVSGGHMHVLLWLQEIGCPFNPRACATAAAAGRPNLLQSLRAHGCPWDGESTLAFLEWIEYTVANPHVHRVMSTVEWALANGCPCSDTSRSRYAQLQRIVQAAQACGCV